MKDGLEELLSKNQIMEKYIEQNKNKNTYFGPE